VELLEGGSGRRGGARGSGRRFGRRGRQGHWYGWRKKKAGNKGTAADMRNKKEIGKVVGWPKRGVWRVVRTTQLSVWVDPLGRQEGGKT
jgi:hypothetical protein